jgi:hypothetical protein
MSWIKRKLLTRRQLKDLKQIRIFLSNHLKEWEKRKKDIPHDVFQTTRFILNGLIDAYESISVLYKQEHYESCIILARTILENSVNLKYIYKKDLERKARNFAIFPMKSWVEKSKKFDGIEMLGKEELINAMKKELETYLPSGTRSNYWDGKSIKELFEEVNLTKLYTEGYSRLSGFTHSNFKGPVDMHEDRPYFDFIRRFIFVDILVVTLEALKLMNEKYNLLEGLMLIEDYPHDGAVTLFSVNNNNLEKPVGK